MADTHSGRFTDGGREALVVFLIGMRVNRWRAVRAWWPTMTAMPRMLRELSQDPRSGLLGYRLLIGAGGPYVVQYWRDLDALLAYAHDPEQQHRPAWRDFNTRARESHGAVGIWHETYAVPAGAHESMYVDMPVTGLAAATSHVPVGRRTDTARDRLIRAAS